MKRIAMDRFIDTIEWIAAVFVGIVAADIFISPCCCATSSTIRSPTRYDFGRLLLGILIFWGIAATSYRGTHITVDLVWANVSPKYQRVIDVFATLVLLFVVTVQTYTLFDKVRGTYYDNVLTFDLRLPTWPFFAVAWAGDVSAVLLIAVRTYRLIVQPELIGEPQTKSSRSSDAMSTDAVAIIGFVALFALMLLRVPVGMAMGLVGVSGFGYLVGGMPALKMVGADLDAHGDRLHFRRHPDVPADGRVHVQLRHEPRPVPRRQRFRRPSARRTGHRHDRRLRRLCRDLRLVGRDRGHVLRRRLSGNAPLRLSAELRHRRDRGRRHARRHAAAVDRARGLRHHHRAGHRQAVHRRHRARASRHGDVPQHHHRHRPRAARLPAGRPAHRLARAAYRPAGHLGAVAAVRFRHRRPLRPAVPAALHADRGRRRRRRRRVPDRRSPPAGSTRTKSWPRCCRRRAPPPPCSPC